jgi:UDP-3-O-[3-hydroxymyristoyl] glucosamine N-acyltransferase
LRQIFNMDFTASQIASFLSGTVEGNPDVLINTFSKIEEGSQGALTFLSNEKTQEKYGRFTRAEFKEVNKEDESKKDKISKIEKFDLATINLVFELINSEIPINYGK